MLRIKKFSFFDTLLIVFPEFSSIRDLTSALLIPFNLPVTKKVLLFNKPSSEFWIASLIEENSGTTVSTVSKKLNYLIVGEKPTKKKVDYAKQLKIKVIDQAELLKMLNKSS